MPSTEQLQAALATVIDPNTGKDFVSTRALKNLQLSGGDVSFDVELGYPAKSQLATLRRMLVAAARTVSGVDNVSVNITTCTRAGRVPSLVSFTVISRSSAG